MQEVVPPVRAQTVRLDGSSQSASYSGEVRGRYETNLAFQVSGKVMKRNVELGSVVSAGDSLMEINPQDIEQAVNVSSAQVYAAQSQLALAKSNLERYRQLYEQNAVSRAQFEQYQNAYDIAVAAVRQSSAQYAQGSNQLGYSTLTADSAGVISSINAETGQVVGAGQTVLTLVRDGEREIEINIPENRMEELRKAGTIRVSFWALPGLVIEGKVREVSPIADKVSRTYKARILLVNPPQQMKLGMTANVDIASLREKKTAFIPLPAIYQTDGTPKVWVIKDAIVNLRPITIGNFGDGKVQVLEGLADGEVVVTAGVHKLREGQKVKVTGDPL
jgi:RND family efflux transporter MFP subunit